MASIAPASSAPGHFPGGVHPPAHKALAAAFPIQALPHPKQLVVPIQQHIGAPATPCVEARAALSAGQRIAEAKGFISAHVHAPLAGTAQKPANVTIASGRHLPAIPITVAADNPGGEQSFQATLGGHWDLGAIAGLEPSAIAPQVAEAGVAGMGGAAFPTHVKLSAQEKAPIDTVLVNGCECEPYLTADDRVMIEAPQAVLAGALIAARALAAGRVVIAIEQDKTRAMASLKEAIAQAGQALPGVSVEIIGLTPHYPMGGERQTIRAALGRIIPEGGLPSAVGTMVINVGSCTAVAAAVLRGLPMTHRVVTVTGRGIAQPANLWVPIGTPIEHLIAHCGGLTPQAQRVISGGPMMGFALGNLSAPVTKGTSGITVLTDADLGDAPRTACIRCGRCGEVCPMRLVPSRLALASRHENWDLARSHHILHCMECGCCSYVCPASIPLVQWIRVGKACLPRD